MAKAKVIFNIDGVNTTILCLNDNIMKDICERYVKKIKQNLDSLLFLYEGNQINFELTFENHANSFDKTKNEMKILFCKQQNNNIISSKFKNINETNIKNNEPKENNKKTLINNIK